MAQTQYRPNKIGTLQDLLNQETLKPSSWVEAPAPPEAPQVNTEGMLTPQDRQSLLDVLFTPEELGPAPAVDKPNALAMLFSGLGDATNAFNAARTGNSGLQSDFFDQYQRTLNQQKVDRQKYVEGLAKSRERANKGKAEFLLGEDASARERQLAASAAKAAEEKADRLLREKIQRETVATVEDRAFQLKKQQEASVLDREENEARFRHETGLKKLELAARGKDDPKTEKALQQFSLGSRIANGILRGVSESKDGPAIPPLAQRLIGDPENNIPPQTPDEIRREFEDEMTQEGIFGPPRDLARDYFNERLIRTWRQVKQQAEQARPPG
jgi:hypothetical protein